MSGFFTVIKAAITNSGLEAAPYEVVKKAEVSYFFHKWNIYWEALTTYYLTNFCLGIWKKVVPCKEMG